MESLFLKYFVFQKLFTPSPGISQETGFCWHANEHRQPQPPRRNIHMAVALIMIVCNIDIQLPFFCILLETVTKSRFSVPLKLSIIFILALELLFADRKVKLAVKCLWKSSHLGSLSLWA